MEPARRRRRVRFVLNRNLGTLRVYCQVGGMATFDPHLHGARWADNYDEWHQGLMDDEGRRGRTG